MAMALGRATADPSGSMRPDRAIIAKGDEICTRSEGLCSHARIIQEGLSALGREIEKLRDGRRKQGFWSKLKEWLAKIFGIVAHLISGVTSLLGIAHPAAIAGSAIFSALSDVAYIFMNSEFFFFAHVNYSIESQVTRQQKQMQVKRSWTK